MEDYGNRDWELPCVCGHLKLAHEFMYYQNIQGRNGENSYCKSCAFRGRGVIQVHKFVVDNLTLVEQIARARKLI